MAERSPTRASIATSAVAKGAPSARIACCTAPGMVSTMAVPVTGPSSATAAAMASGKAPTTADIPALPAA